MSASDLRTSYDGILTYNVTAPASGGVFTQVWTLLTTAQQAEISAGRTTLRMELFATAPLDFKMGTPGNLSVLDPNSGAQHLIASQKPNEAITVPMPELVVYLRSSGVAQTVQLTLYFVNNVNL